jgi:uncharacterized membrane protein YgdD (TMEM256/DUF423 family)
MLALAFLIVAVILFAVSAITDAPKCVPIGLAFFAGSFLVGRV